MKRLTQSMAALLAVAGALTLSRAELVTQQSDSIFDADGLMVDNAETGVATNEVFRVGIKPSQAVEDRQPGMMRRRSRAQSSLQAASDAQLAAQANLQAADVYAQRRNWSQALIEIQQGLELDPDNFLLLKKAAAFAALSRKFGVADQYFQKVLNVEPDNLLFLTGHAGVLIRLLRWKEADERLQKAFAIDPNFLAARFNRLCVQIARQDKNISMGGWALLTLENITEVAKWLDADKQDYEKALGPEGYKKLCEIVLGPGADTRVTEIVGLLKKANLAFQARQWADCESALIQIKKAGVRAVGVDVNIGRCLYEKGEKDAALARFKALTDQHPTSSSILYDYAYILVNLELYGEASKVLEQVCQLNPGDGQAAFALACCYASLGQPDRAWTILTRLASSHAAELHIWLAGDKPYQKALQKDPKFAEFQKSVEAAQPRTR